MMMRSVPRLAGMLLLLALMIGPIATTAQTESDDPGVRVVGSGVVAPLFEALADTSDVEDVVIEVTGTNRGFEMFCGGGADITLAARGMTVAEEAVCVQNEVAFLELLLGYDILAFITSPDSDLPQCLTVEQLRAAFAPSAFGQVLNWNQISPDFPDADLAVIIPAVDTATYALADAVIEGAGLRGDVTLEPDDASVIRHLAQAEGALGFVRLPEALAAEDDVRILEVDAGAGTGCQPPTAANVESRVYGAADELLAYVNAASLDEEGVRDLLNTVVNEEAATIIETAGFTAQTGEQLARTAAVLAEGRTGREFSRQAATFEIPDQLFGAISLAGSPNAATYLQNLTTAFTAQFPAVTTDARFLGLPAGVDRLCAGELDILVSNDVLTDDDLAGCVENNIAVEAVPLGSEAAVLVANAESEFLGCLTTEQIATVFRAESADTVTNWDLVGEDFPDEDVFLFAPAAGDPVTDLMMVAVTGVATPIRTDVAEENADPLYRAAAVANVPGALTVMTWPDYLQVVENGQENIQLVAVDAGSGCIAPNVETIAEGDYPLAEPVVLYVPQTALARSDVQALLWYALSDENFALLTESNIVGLVFGELPETRSALQAMFEEAVVQAAIAAEATPEPDVEIVDEATEEAEPAE